MRTAAVISAALLVLLTVGCGVVEEAGKSAVQKGDCLTQEGTEFKKVDCGGAAYVVVGRAGTGQPQKGCIDVAGTQYVYYEDGSDVCVGTKGADHASAVNVAQVGECLTEASGDPKRVECTDPTARYRILARETASTIGPDMACQKVSGTERSYTFLLKTTAGIGKGLGSGIAFCLAGKDTDTSKTVDNAKKGSCLQKTGSNTMTIVDCASPEADYKVLLSGMDQSWCNPVSGVIATYSFKRPGEIFTTYLCLGSPR
ncbi:hypothetical protein AB0C65_36355 [Nocardia sp. NPDC048505]|uniref:LppU/SCO3897 family protein n=1 Tax=Nocardia sp. NPDC048505 TaxID=3155756 RepID=UPI0033C0DF12